jgi:hypothetical protein
MTQQNEDTSSNLFNQLRKKAKVVESFCLVLDESCDTRGAAQLSSVIPGKSESFEVVEELS